MDSSELNKIAGGVIAALLVFMLLNFFSAKIFGTSGHHEMEALAYAVEIEAGGGEEPEEVEINVADLLASADAGAGEKIFKKCGACHKADKNGAGPMLGGVFGRDIASAAGFGYSGGLSAAEGNWDAEKLFSFLANPKDWGSSMPAQRSTKDPEDRAAVIKFLETYQ